MKNLKSKITNHKSKGFSLVELLVVITIIAILSVVAYVALGGQTAKARNSRVMNDLATIQSALEIYYLDSDNSSQYPMVATWDTDLIPNYITKVPTRPDDDTENYYYYQGGGSKQYALGAVIEDTDSGGLAHKAYLIGNATQPIVGGGCTYTPATGACACATTCNLSDESTTCLPYCL